MAPVRRRKRGNAKFTVETNSVKDAVTTKKSTLEYLRSGCPHTRRIVGRQVDDHLNSYRLASPAFQHCCVRWRQASAFMTLLHAGPSSGWGWAFVPVERRHLSSLRITFKHRTAVTSASALEFVGHISTRTLRDTKDAIVRVAASWVPWWK